ncbi:CPBP family intramembrane glutamic endopeptidase [Ichthyenterobacterium magnum]|uniref:CAAX prenyl protease-like protein n=1 Tax=Ichthyenterobacterium magnum TaxID=1230530 RepID=A0A420DGS8_9FLAO|nr:CPBP family intramembrane glutamic endopeptidase [Ichthyenterobacterium magnum]RKE92286.1 CAAX prenyl protease-like protein [Ichthyenterobacterium magnum]
MLSDYKLFLKHLYIKVSNNKITFLLILILGLTIEMLSFYNGNVTNSTAYLGVLLLCVLLIEFYTFIRPIKKEWLIKKARQENIMVMFCIFISYCILAIRFLVIDDFQATDKSIKIALMVFVGLFIYPVFLAFYFLRLKNYKLKEIGFGNWKCFWVAFPIIIMFAIVAFGIMPDKIQFGDIIEEKGVLSLITLGFLTAAIPEEFTRLLFQTRLGKVLSNRGLGWFIASFIWAMGHIFIFSNQTQDYLGAFISAIGIFPLGLFWGYLTEKFKSMIPSVLIHGTNLWGIQNIF